MALFVGTILRIGNGYVLNDGQGMEVFVLTLEEVQAWIKKRAEVVAAQPPPSPQTEAR